MSACYTLSKIRILECQIGESESIFKTTIWNESLRQDINGNCVRIVNFATSKNLILETTMFPHRSIYQHTQISPDVKIHNQIDHILIDSRWHSSIRFVRSFSGTE